VIGENAYHITSEIEEGSACGYSVPFPDSGLSRYGIHEGDASLVGDCLVHRLAPVRRPNFLLDPRLRVNGRSGSLVPDFALHPLGIRVAVHSVHAREILRSPASASPPPTDRNPELECREHQFLCPDDLRIALWVNHESDTHGFNRLVHPRV
jgi:hypothetical protein